MLSLSIHMLSFVIFLHSGNAIQQHLISSQTISEVKLEERERLCNTGRGKGTKGTAIAELEESYMNKVTQYASIMPTLLSYNIQRIGLTAITLATDSYDANVRDAINTAIYR